MSSEFDKSRKILADNMRGLMHIYFIDNYPELVQLLSIDISPSGISAYATGKGSRLEVIAALADAFDVSTADMLTDGFAASLRDRAFAVPALSAVTTVVPIVPNETDNPVRERPHTSFRPDDEDRSTLLFLMDGVHLTVTSAKTDLGISSQDVYNFINSKANVLVPAKRFIASYLAAKLEMTIDQVHRLRGKKGRPTSTT